MSDRTRLDAQERMITTLNARIEKLAADMTASFRQQAAYQLQLEQHLDTRFDAVHQDIQVLRVEMTAKLETIESRFIDAFQQLLKVLDSRLPPGR